MLQPENIVFTEADFDEPLGPGNPLAAAVRAAREQMLLQGSADPQNMGEPYPLLLVRPAGILAYDCALAAMKSWGSEFGYELINDDWQLKYPPPDPNLARSVARPSFLARQEHARLIAAAPSKYGKRPRIGSYRSSTGGEAGEQGRAGEGESTGFYSSKPSERYGQAASGDGSAATTGRNGRGSAGDLAEAVKAKETAATGGGLGSGGGVASGPTAMPNSPPTILMPRFLLRAWSARPPCSRWNGNRFGLWSRKRNGRCSGIWRRRRHGGLPSMIAGGMGNGPGYGPANGTGGAPGPAWLAAWPVRRA